MFKKRETIKETDNHLQAAIARVKMRTIAKPGKQVITLK
jgi:hypothetical protein